MPYEIVTQKCVFEIRFPAKIKMLNIAADIADHWYPDYPGINNISPHQIILTDEKQFRTVSFTLNHTSLDVEGDIGIERFILIAQRMAENVRDIIKPVRIERLGLRFFDIVPYGTAEECLALFINRYFPDSVNWSGNGESDKISDAALVLEMNSSPTFFGRVNFGPYVPSVNKAIFSYKTHPALEKIETGFLFDTDYGQGDLPKTILNKVPISSWIQSAKTVNDTRIKVLLKQMGIE